MLSASPGILRRREMKKEREIIIISGRTGTGKSYLSRSLYQAWDRRVIYDPQREHDRSELPRSLHSFRGFHVPVYDAEYAAELAMLSGDCVLVLDDAYAFVRHPLGERLKEVCNTGRHRGVSMIVVTQRVPDVAPDLRAQVDLWVAFRSVLRSDNEALYRDWGFEDLESLERFQYKVQSYTDKPLRTAALLHPA